MATIRQKKAFGKILENKGKSVSGAMRDAGYPATTAKNPQQLTGSKAYREFFGKTFTPEYMRKHHDQLMNLKQLASMDVDPEVDDETMKALIEAQGFTFLRIGRWTEKRGRDTEIEKAKMMFVIPDGLSKRAGLDMAYKITGDYAAEKIKVEDDLPVTDDELDEAIMSHEKTLERFKNYRRTKSGRRKVK